jgi:hypothetical protein
MRHRTRFWGLAVVALLAGAPGSGEAGPPLLCHPFETSGGEMLPWGSGPGWNTPDPDYDVERLTADVLRLLSPDAHVLTRMENMRRAVIYATRSDRVADGLLHAVLARADGVSGGRAGQAALFDAGYLVETFTQAALLHRRAPPPVDGYALVQRALAMSESNPEMEFAASLMTTGPRSAGHLRRARAGASAPLARNIANQGR